LDATRYNLAAICQTWAGIRTRLKADPAETQQKLNEAMELLRDIRRNPLQDPTDSTPPPRAFEVCSQLHATLLQTAAAELKAGRTEQASAAFIEIQTSGDQLLAEVDAGQAGVAGMDATKVALVRSHFRSNIDLAKSGLANLLVRTGRADEAIPLYQALINSRREAMQTTPEDRNLADQMIRQLANFGQYLIRVQRPEQSAVPLAEAVQIGERLLLEDPESIPTRRLLATAQYYLATARKLQKQTDEATALFERSRLHRVTILAAADSVASQVDLMLSQAQLGMLADCRLLIDKLTSTDVKNADLRIDVARSLSLLAEQAATPELAAPLQQEAVAALERAVAEGLEDRWIVETQVDLTGLRSLPAYQNILPRIQPPAPPSK
jgi:tetratricopeptide (TPR) repeat protein